MRIHFLVNHQILHPLNHDDGVVHHQPDRQDHGKQSKNIDVKPQQINNAESGDQRHRNGNQRNKGGLGLLQKNISYQHHQGKGNDQRFNDTGDR